MKRSPEEQAKALATRMAEASRKLAAATVNGAIGEMLLALLARQDAVSVSDLVAAFQVVIDDRGPGAQNNLVVLQAEECISVLRALQTGPASLPADTAEA